MFQLELTFRYSHQITWKIYQYFSLHPSVPIIFLSIVRIVKSVLYTYISMIYNNQDEHQCKMIVLLKRERERLCMTMFTHKRKQCLLAIVTVISVSVLMPLMYILNNMCVMMMVVVMAVVVVVVFLFWVLCFTTTKTAQVQICVCTFKRSHWKSCFPFFPIHPSFFPPLFCPCVFAFPKYNYAITTTDFQPCPLVFGFLFSVLLPCFCHICISMSLLMVSTVRRWNICKRQTDKQTHCPKAVKSPAQDTYCCSTLR